jgi:predicted nucleic acid-binding protein
VVLVDAGPLVALLNRSDPHHKACRDVLVAERLPLMTVWPAFTEAMYLLRDPSAQDALWHVLESGAIGMASLGVDDASRIRALMARYRDLPMDFADAALVRIAERENTRRIITVDRRDFSIYRINDRDPFEIRP